MCKQHDTSCTGVSIFNNPPMPAQECAHDHWRYCGTIPCTGPIICTTCGTRADSIPLAQMPDATLHRVYNRALTHQRANRDPEQTLPILERLRDAYREIEGRKTAANPPNQGRKAPQAEGIMEVEAMHRRNIGRLIVSVHTIANRENERVNTGVAARLRAIAQELATEMDNYSRRMKDVESANAEGGTDDTELCRADGDRE